MPATETASTTQVKLNVPDPKRFIRLMLFAWLCLAVFSYIAVSPIVCKNLYYRLLFLNVPYPHGYYDKSTVDGIKARDITIPSTNDVQLHAWYFEKPNSKYVVLMNHGNGGNLSILGWYADLALKAGASVLLYDYRGYGKSTGTPSITGICEDSQSAYNYLTHQMAWSPKRVVNMGFSLGTGPAANLSSKNSVAGTILISPYTSIETTGSDVLPWLKIYPPFMWPEPDMGSAAFVARAHSPLLAIHGTEDNVIPIKYFNELKSKAQQPSKFISLQCGHGDLGRVHDQIQSQISGFIQRLDSTTQ